MRVFFFEKIGHGCSSEKGIGITYEREKRGRTERKRFAIQSRNSIVHWTNKRFSFIVFVNY